MENKKAVVIDIESNGLLEDMVDYSSFPYKLRDDARLWVVAFCDVETGKVVSKVKEKITREWIEKVVSHYDTIIAHNGLKFDFLALWLFGLLDYKVNYNGESTVFGKPIEFADTLVWSRLFYPDRYGGHGLEVWGERLGQPKTDFRQLCIDKGYIPADAPKGAEFKQFVPEMELYCQQDTRVNREVYLRLLEDRNSYNGWEEALKVETKLADLAVRRENFGFWFDKDSAIKVFEELDGKMQEIEKKINPILPKRKLNSTEVKYYSFPAKPFKKDGTPSSALYKFAEKVGGIIINENENYYLGYIEEKIPVVPLQVIISSLPATIKDMDHIKMHLLNLKTIKPEYEHLYTKIYWENE